MKGIVFTVFNQLVEEKFGLSTWDNVIEKSKTSTQGSYTAAATYDDSEIFALVGALSQETKIPANDLVAAFGEYLFHKLAAKYPHFLKGVDFKKFLLSIEHVIHIEVKKIYPDAGLPTFAYETPSSDELIMTYRSPRKLCQLAEGLIKGASSHFSAQYTLKHETCMHKGADECRLHIYFKASS